MRHLSLLCLSVACALGGVPGAGEQDDHPPMKIERFGGKILAISSFTDNSRILAVSTEKGLVVVNTTWSPDSAEHMKSIIEKEFGRSGYAFVINTDDGDTRVYGNAAFKGVPIIAHAQTLNRLVATKDMLRDELASRAVEFDQRVARTENQLKDVEPGSIEAKFDRDWIDYCRVIARDMKKEFEFLFPNVTFTEKLALDMGDMTIRLLSYRLAPGDGQIALVIPEEGVVFLGDLFHAGHLLPRLERDAGEMDVSAWIKMLNGLLGEENNVRYVLRSNGPNWTRQRMVEQIQFITGLANHVEACDSAGKSLEQTIEGIIDLRTSFPFISGWDIMYENILENDTRNFIHSLWSRNHEPASAVLLQVLKDKGIDAAKARFQEILNGENTSVYLLESDLNRAGYALLGEGRVPEAIAVFEMNVSAFPDSGNVYDSLGEALMNAGRIEEAIANYKKSIELDPGNENAKAKIKEMLEAGS